MPDDTEHPIAPLSRLAGRASEALREQGIDMVSFLIQPGADPSGPHRAQLMLTLRPEDDKPPVDEHAEADDEIFGKLTEGHASQTQQERAERAREGLRDLADDLKNPNRGIGLDD